MLFGPDNEDRNALCQLCESLPELWDDQRMHAYLSSSSS